MCASAEKTGVSVHFRRGLSAFAVAAALLPGLALSARPERAEFADIDALIASTLDAGPVRVRGCLYYTPALGAHLFVDCDALQDDVPVSVALDFRKARKAIFKWRQRAFACVEFDGEWTRHPAPEVVGWTRDHGKIVATFAMRQVKGCSDLNAPTGIDAGIAAADLAVRFESDEDAAEAVGAIVEYVALSPSPDRASVSPRSHAMLRRWQGSRNVRIARGADEVMRVVQCRPAEACPEPAEIIE